MGFVLFLDMIAKSCYDSIGYVVVEEHLKENYTEDTTNILEFIISEYDTTIKNKISKIDSSLDIVTDTLLIDSDSMGTHTVVNDEIIKNDTITEKNNVWNLQENIVSEHPEHNINTKNADIDHRRYFENLKRTYLQPIISKLSPNRFRTDITIRYYKHKPDEKKVYELKELKYYIHERKVQGDASLKESSNALFYGNNIKIEDIKIVVYTLLQNGVPIKSIQPSKFGSSWKSNAIEIGVKDSLDNKNIISLEQLRNLDW